MRKKLIIIIAFACAPIAHGMAPAQEQLSVQDLIDRGELPAIENGFLDLSEKGLTSLEGLQHIPEPLEIRKLSLAQNRIALIPDHVFDRFVNLDWLALSSNPLVQIKPAMLVKLINLEELYLQNTDLVEVPPAAFDTHPKLRVLNLGNNKLQTLPKDLLEALTELTSLDLQNNQITSLDPNLLRFQTKLEELGLHWNNLSQLPHLTQLAALKELYIEGNKEIVMLPDDLVAFIIKHNVGFDAPKLLHGIPTKSAGDLIAALGENWSDELIKADPTQEDAFILNMNNRGLTSLSGLPDELADMVITKVTAKNNFLREIPEGFFVIGETNSLRFPHLRDLNLSNNLLWVLPIHLSTKCPVLEKLDFTSNRIVAVPHDLFSPHGFHPTLRVLELDNNRISTIESGAFQELPALEELYIPRNKLHILPKNIFANLVALQTLILTHNNLGNQDQYVFPPEAAVKFYPQEVPALKLLAAKKVAENWEAQNLIQITKQIQRMPSQMVDALLKAASRNVAIKINHALQLKDLLVHASLMSDSALKRLVKALPDDQREAFMELAPLEIRVQATAAPIQEEFQRPPRKKPLLERLKEKFKK